MIYFWALNSIPLTMPSSLVSTDPVDLQIMRPWFACGWVNLQTQSVAWIAVTAQPLV